MSPTQCQADEIPATEQRAIFFDGPFSYPDPKGEKEETPYWTVYAGYADREPVRTVYQVSTYKRAKALAANMAKDRNLPLESEATPA